MPSEPPAVPPVSVVVFAYNEGQNVQPVLEELLQWLDAHQPGAQVVLVDDGSSDDTGQRARELLSAPPHKVLAHDDNRGIGAAIKTGVSHSDGELITFMPADGQIEPAAVGTLLEARQRHSADLVLSVYSDRDDGWNRKVTSWGVRALIRAVHGVQMRSDGPYLFRRDQFERERLASDSFFLNFEFPIRMLARGVPAAEVTINCRRRWTGHSKSTSLGTMKVVGRELLALRLRRLLE